MLKKHKITTYIDDEQHDWVKSLPRSYNLSEKLRQCLDKLKDQRKKEVK